MSSGVDARRVVDAAGECLECVANAGGGYFEVLSELRRMGRGYARGYAMWTVDAEVGNGGLRQFYVNRMAVLLPAAIAGYERIGQCAMSEILRSSIQAHEGSLIQFGATQDEARESIQHLHELTQAYYTEKRKLPGMAGSSSH